MKREDYIWVAIRVFGIYLLVRAVMTVPMLISTGYSTWALHVVINAELETETSPMYSFARRIALTQVSTLISSAIKTVLFVLAGVYLLKRGVLVFNLVSGKNPSRLSNHENGSSDAAQPANELDA